jgi:hypothetical protein
MTPEALLGNIRTLLTVILPVLSGAVLVGGGVLYVGGKGVNSHEWISWGKRAMLASLVGFGFSGVSALMQNIAQRIMGGGGA